MELTDQQARKLGAILGGAVPEPSETLHAGDRLIIIARHQDSGPFHKLVVD